MLMAKRRSLSREQWRVTRIRCAWYQHGDVHSCCVHLHVDTRHIESSSHAIVLSTGSVASPSTYSTVLMALGKPLEEYSSAELDDLLKVCFVVHHGGERGKAHAR